MMHATTRAAIASPSPSRGGDGSHAIEDGERAGPVAGESNALERNAADLYRRALRTETAIRLMSTTAQR